MKNTRFPIGPLMALLFLFFLCSCEVSRNFPPKKIRLPVVLNEASGLTIMPDQKTALLHNDSGDGANVYRLYLLSGKVAETSDLGVSASDWEDSCKDDLGHIYLGDFGNNLGKREQQTVYRFTEATGETVAINFTYPGQNSAGINVRGNYNCEAMVYLNDELHLFTKAIGGGKKAYWAYQFKLPAQPGNYVAELVDSIYLPRRIITGAALDREQNELLLISYNYKRWLGFFPAVASSVIRFRSYVGSNFLRGEMKRKNVSWGIPVQYEAVDFYDVRFYYIGTEKVPNRRSAFLKRKRRF